MFRRSPLDVATPRRGVPADEPHDVLRQVAWAVLGLAAAGIAAVVTVALIDSAPVNRAIDDRHRQRTACDAAGGTLWERVSVDAALPVYLCAPRTAQAGAR
jgi:hypothetical protein